MGKRGGGERERGERGEREEREARMGKGEGSDTTSTLSADQT